MLDELYPHAAGGRADRDGSSIKLGALSTLNNLQVLRALMIERRPGRTLEVGLGFGGSALTIAASHRELGQPAATPAHRDRSVPGHRLGQLRALEALDRAGLGGYVDVRGSSFIDRRWPRSPPSGRSVSSTSTARTCSRTCSSTPISASACCRTAA